MSYAAASDSEKEAALGAIMHYIAGAESGSVETLRPGFHPDATIYGYIGPDLFGGPIQMFFDWHESNGPAADMIARVDNISIEGSIALVRLEIDNWTGHKFTDMFTLLKTDGEWKIISKVFYLHPEAE